MLPDPTNADCRTTFHAAHTSGKRPVSAIWWIFLHDEEAGTASSAANWFANPNSEGSAHLCVDDNVCFRTLGDDDIAWAMDSKFANTHSFSIEQAGYAKWSVPLWKKHWKTLRRAAYKTAYHCHKFGIPPYFVWAADLRKGKRGVSTHAESTKAFGGNHTDPGPLWPRYIFMVLVRRYFKQLGPTV
jgi:hypothetical protein